MCTCVLPQANLKYAPVVPTKKLSWRRQKQKAYRQRYDFQQSLQKQAITPLKFTLLPGSGSCTALSACLRLLDAAYDDHRHHTWTATALQQELHKPQTVIRRKIDCSSNIVTVFTCTVGTLTDHDPVLGHHLSDLHKH